MEPDSRTFSPRKEIVLVVCVLLLAALLRLGWPGLTHFQADEARLYTRALAMAREGDLATHGIASSTGFPNSPVSVWLYALPLLLWPHVYATTLFTGLANLAAAAGAWWLARRYWGPVAGLVTLLLFAVAPWAVIHARRIWAQNLLAPLAVIWGIAALLAFVERRPRFVVVHLVALALAAQVHFAGIALLPATLVFFIIFRRRLQWRATLAGVGLAVASALPFLVYLGRQDGTGLKGLMEQAGSGSAWQPVVWRYLWLLSSGSELHSLVGPEQYRPYLASLPPLWPIYLVLGALMVAGAGRMGRQAWQKHTQGAPGGAGEVAFILIVWLLAPPLLFLIFPAPAVMHYLLPSYPVPFVAAGAGFAFFIDLVLRRQRTGYMPHLLWGLLLVAVSLQLWGTIRLHQVVAEEATPGGFSTPLRLLLEGVEQAEALWLRTGGEVLIAGSGENSDIDETPAIYEALLAHVPHRFVDARRSALFPGEPVVVLLAADVPPESGPAQLYRDTGEEETQVPLRPGEGVVEILRLEQPPEPTVTLDEPVLFANWVRLFGYDPLRSGAGQSARWALYWHPGDNPDPADYHLFNHLLDGAGSRIAQADAAAFAPWQWRSGDTVVSVFELDLPERAAAPLTIRVGFYRYPSIENVPVLDVALNPASDAVELPAE